MSEAEMMRRGAAQANAENDRYRANQQTDEQTELLRQIRDLLKSILAKGPE